MDIFYKITSLKCLVSPFLDKPDNNISSFSADCYNLSKHTYVHKEERRYSMLQINKSHNLPRQKFA